VIRAVYVADVGDGLAAGMRTLDGTSIEIDCGSQDDAQKAFQRGLARIMPDVLFLSHFHIDHYNGLLIADAVRPRPALAISKVYYPRLPRFQQREQFLLRLLAMNRWVIGNNTGSPTADFLSLISRINRIDFTYQSLCMGNKVAVGGCEYEVLWPPEELPNNAPKYISQAISDFDAAAEEHGDLREILDQIGESGERHPYLAEDGETRELSGLRESAERHADLPFPYRGRSMPDLIRIANASLRKAANHLSLALHERGSLLFMGDLEGPEIKAVVGILEKKNRRHFFVTLTPHHGTHWHKDLEKIHTWFAISSAGPRRSRALDPRYESISGVHLATGLNGDIEVPGLPPWHAPGLRSFWSLCP
jgi:hypothetical protein